MFSICESMKWANLPNAGGVYDQDPVLMDGFQIIFAERAEFEERKRKEEDNKAKSAQRRSSSRGASRAR